MDLAELIQALEARLESIDLEQAPEAVEELDSVLNQLIRDTLADQADAESYQSKVRWLLDRAMSAFPDFSDIAFGDFAHRSIPRAPPVPRLPSASPRLQNPKEIANRLIDIRARLNERRAKLAKSTVEE